MAITTAVTTASSLAWAQSDTDATDSTKLFKDSGQFAYAKNTIDAASGVGSTNMVWHSRLSISGTKQILDLRALSTVAFGSTITETIGTLREIYIENASTGIGYTANIHTTGIAGMTGLFNGGSGNLTIYPSSRISYNSWTPGWAVTTGNKDITINDDSGS